MPITSPQFQYFLDCLERSDAAGFSARLEKLVRYKMDLIVGQLTELGVSETA